ncbi:MAG: RNA-binding protein [Burkholderiales bacterium]|jgi:RNA recognition motif-containing protein|nr:RNA-binding protein [Burkholderiales bacterium]
MQKSLFVAGLDYSITSTDLQELFAAHGTVTSAKVITDKFTSQSKGFGFVDMESQADAENCIKALNNTTYKNRSLVVKEKEDKPRTNGNSGGGYRSNSQNRSW